MTDEAERILDKVRKLQAHADSAALIGSEAEAQAFAARVQELLTAYKLSRADVDRPGDPKAAEQIGTSYFGWADLDLRVRHKRVGWAEHLARLVADTYYSKFVVTTYGGRIGFFVGHETDRKIAVFMFVTLARFLHQLADRETRRHHYQTWKGAGAPKTGAIPEVAHGFRAGFIVGFLDRLYERFDEEIRPRATAANTQAIVLLRRDTLARIDTWAKENLDLRNCPHVGISDGSNTAGKKRGRAAADELNLHPHPVAGTAAPRRSLR